jgi:hypothetical protein
LDHTVDIGDVVKAAYRYMSNGTITPPS